MTAPDTGSVNKALFAMLDSLAEDGDKPAVIAIGRDDKEEWSRRSLADAVGRLTSGLADTLSPGDRAVLIGSNSPDWIVCALAVVAAGGVAVPLDVQLVDDTLEGILEDAGPTLVFGDAQQLARIDALESETSFRMVRLDERDDDESPDAPHWRELLQEEPQNPNEADPEDTALLFYTSGTTGPPKGVPLSHRNLGFQIESLRNLNLIKSNDRVLLPLPLHHVYPFVVGTLVPLALRLPLIVPRALTGPQVRRAMSDGRVTAVIGVPKLYTALVESIERELHARGRLVGGMLEGLVRVSGALRRYTGLRAGRWLLYPVHRRLDAPLRLLASGGSALPPAMARKLEAYGWAVGTGYGLTETAPLLSVNHPDAARFETAGRVLDGVDLHVEAPNQTGEDAPELEPGYGEVLARGPGVFKGYWNLPDKTEEALEDEWFRTGDLGRVDDDGYLHLAGRASTLIVTPAGKNIQPDEVEERYAAHPLLREVGVLQRDDRLVAVVLPDPGEVAGLDAEALASRIEEAMDEQARVLPSYEQVQDWVIAREPLERTRLGKLRRHRLAERYDTLEKNGAGGEPVEQHPVEIGSMSAEDRTVLEDPAARKVWNLLAERYADRHLDPDSRLQRDLGVDSMDWLDLGLQIEDEAGIALDDEAIANIQTVRDLLEEASRARGREADAASPFEDPGAALEDADERWLRPLGTAGQMASRGIYAIDRGLVHAAYDVEIGGRDQIPEERPIIFVANHLSYLDPFLLAAALPPRVLDHTYWGGWTGVVFNRQYKRLIARLGRVVPIDPSMGARRNLAFATRILRDERNLIWFPEGQRSEDGDLQEFREGIGRLLLNVPVTVVPVAIRGTHDVLPPHRRWPSLRDTLRLRFGEPVSAQALRDTADGDSAGAVVRTLRDRVAELIETMDAKS